MTFRFRSFHRPCLAVLIGVSVSVCSAQEPVPNKVGRMITIRGVVDSSLASRVTSAYEDAVRAGVETIIFDIQVGSSEFGPCRDLANRISKLGNNVRRTVAYVSQPLTGQGVLIALACQEIVMNDSARLGDANAGRQEDADRTETTAYEEIASRAGHDRSIVLGLIDKKVRLLEVSTPNGRRLLLGSEMEAFEKNARILKSEVVKEAGERFILSAEQAKRIGLSVRTVASRAEAVLAYGLPESTSAEDQLLREATRPALLKIDGHLGARTEEHVARRLKQAENAGTNLLFVQIDSKNGDETSASRIAELINGFPGHKVAWIGPKTEASGPAVLVIFGCDELAMAPSATVGNFRLEKGGPNDYVGFARSAAEWAKESRFPQAIVAGMIDPATEVVEVEPVDGKPVKSYRTAVELQDENTKKLWRIKRNIKPKGSVFSLTGEVARSVDLASANPGSNEELFAAFNVTGGVRILDGGWVDVLIDMLTSTGGTFFLVVIGLTCLYIEFHMPGFGLPGILSVICFTLFFWSRFLSDTANSLELVLFGVGVILLAVELFVLPGFGVTGFAGILLILASLVLACQSFTVPTSESEVRELLKNMLTLGASVVVFIVTAISLARALPSIPIFRSMVLEPPGANDNADSADGQGFEESRYSAILGRIGTAVTTLRPSGRVEIGDRYYDVVAQGSFIDSGKEIEVIEVYPNRIVVRETSAKT